MRRGSHQGSRSRGLQLVGIVFEIGVFVLLLGVVRDSTTALAVGYIPDCRKGSRTIVDHDWSAKVPDRLSRAVVHESRRSVSGQLATRPACEHWVGVGEARCME